MARITFEPPANREQACLAESVFGSHGMLSLCGFPLREMGCPNIPCDLTLDPTRPETWARAVYEAGVRRGKPLGAAEHLALFGTGMPPPAKGYGKSYTETLLGGVTQQPEGVRLQSHRHSPGGWLDMHPDVQPVWLEAKVPHQPAEHGDSACMSGTIWSVGSMTWFPSRTGAYDSVVINGTEYRPVTPL